LHGLTVQIEDDELDRAYSTQGRYDRRLKNSDLDTWTEDTI